MQDRLAHVISHIAKQQAEKAPVVRYIYLIRCGPYYKIGIATDIPRRLSTLQIGCPYPLKLVKAWPSLNPEQDERQIHSLLWEHNCRGEWFKLPKTFLAALLKR